MSKHCDTKYHGIAVVVLLGHVGFVHFNIRMHNNLVRIISHSDDIIQYSVRFIFTVFVFLQIKCLCFAVFGTCCYVMHSVNNFK